MGEPAPAPTRTWDVLLLGGPSGAGKTAVSYRLARHFGVGITEVDDFQVLLETLTTPEQLPALHVWRTHPDPFSLTSAQNVELLIRIGQVMAPGLEAVIANHLETETPVVLEGDFLLPALAALPAFAGIPNQGRVRAIFVVEDDEQQLVQNFLQREPAHGPQRTRAQVSLLYGQWLRQEADRHGLPVLPARPWETIFERSLDTLQRP